jgi:hypothetical protein
MDNTLGILGKGDGAGADASCLLRRKFSEFSMSRGIPADASGAYRPGPQATTESLPGIFPPIFLVYPPVTEGLHGDILIWPMR